MATPFLKISITGSNGTESEKKVMEPITIAIPGELSLRIAAMHVMEFVVKQFKAKGFKDALKAVGFK